MSVEVPGEDTIERGVRERQRQRVALHHGRPWSLRGGLFEHSLALIERHHVALEVPGQETGAAGDVEGAGRGQSRNDVREERHLGLPVRTLALGEETPSQVPVVVLGRPLVVVLLQHS